MKICEIEQTNRFEGFAIVVASEQRISSAGKAYLNLALADRSGTIGAKFWQEAEPPPAGSVVFIRGTVDNYKGNTQLRISEIREAVEEDGVNPADFLPHSPEPVKKMKCRILNTVMSFKNEKLRGIVSELISMAGPSLWTRPAALQMHHVEIGGLAHHICSILRCAEGIADTYSFLDRELLFAGIIAHDLAKSQEMLLNELGLVSEYSTEGRLLGHIVIGASNVAAAARKVGFPNCEEALLLGHMVLSHHERPEFGSPIPPCFPEAQVLASLDNLDATLFEMTDILRKMEPGTLSGGGNLFRRNLYRRTGYADSIPQEENEDKPESDNIPPAGETISGNPNETHGNFS